MPVWNVEVTNSEDEQVAAGLLATDGGALLAFSEDGLLLRAWAPGQWRTARHLSGADEHPLGRASALVGVPSG